MSFLRKWFNYVIMTAVIAFILLVSFSPIFMMFIFDTVWTILLFVLTFPLGVTMLDFYYNRIVKE